METNRTHSFLCLLVLIAVNLSLFLPSMSGDFLWDDKVLVSENPYILGPGFLKKFLVLPWGGFGGMDEMSRELSRLGQFYRPFSSLSYWIDYKVWGLNPASFHLTNILLHTTNTMILFVVLLNVGWKTSMSFLGALLFSVFPPHFENVSWISGRTDLLSFLFVSLSVLFFLKFLKKKKPVHAAISSFAFLCSLLCKESGLLLIVVYFLILLQRERKFKSAALLATPYAASVLLWFLLRSLALGFFSASYSARILPDFFSAMGFYVYRLLIPFDLSVTVDSQPVFSNVLFLALGGAASLLFMFSIFLLLKRSSKFSKFSLLFASFYLLLLPSATVIFFSSTVSFIAWRFLYLPSALFTSSLVYLLFSKIKHRLVPVLLLSVLCLLCVAEVYPKAKLFGKNESDFWLSIKKVEREDFIAKMNIGLHYLPKDEKKALKVFEELLSQKEHHYYELFEARIYEEIAAYYTLHKDLEKAEKYFNELFKRRKIQSQFAYFNYSYFLALKGEVEEGERIVQNMLQLFPQNHLVLIHAAKFYVIIKDIPRAIILYEKDLALFPSKKTKLILDQLKDVVKSQD
jgi:tetratricopeptide (TPR) repeat protein